MKWYSLASVHDSDIERENYNGISCSCNDFIGRDRKKKRQKTPYCHVLDVGQVNHLVPIQNFTLTSEGSYKMVTADDYFINN